MPVGFYLPTSRLNCLTVNITPVPVGISRHTGSAWTLAGRRLGYSKEASPPRIARPSTAQATCCSTNGPTNGATSGGNMQLNQQFHQRQRQKEVSATAAICGAASRFNNGHTSADNLRKGGQPKLTAEAQPERTRRGRSTRRGRTHAPGRVGADYLCR